MKKLIIPKELFTAHLDELTDEEMEKYAETVAEKTLGFFEFLAESQVEIRDMEEVFSIIVRFLGANGLMWFEHLEYDGTNKPYYLKGIHNLGKNWSKFFMAISQYLTHTYFPFTISESKSRLTTHSVHIVFEENSLSASRKNINREVYLFQSKYETSHQRLF